jgi:hypothetical protein
VNFPGNSDTTTAMQGKMRLNSRDSRNIPALIHSRSDGCPDHQVRCPSIVPERAPTGFEGLGAISSRSSATPGQYPGTTEDHAVRDHAVRDHAVRHRLGTWQFEYWAVAISPRPKPTTNPGLRGADRRSWVVLNRPFRAHEKKRETPQQSWIFRPPPMCAAISRPPTACWRPARPGSAPPRRRSR